MLAARSVSGPAIRRASWIDVKDADEKEQLFVDAIENFLATDYDMDGAIYGAFVGYNWQHGNKVFGVEAGFNGTDFDGHTDCVIGILDCNRELEYYSRVVGRLGYSVSNYLVYGFAGVAWGDVDTSVSLAGYTVDEIVDYFSRGQLSTSLNSSQTHVGWTAGAGLEFAFTDRFFAGVEYAHVDLGEESYDVFSCGECIDIDNNVDMDFDVIKIRASYKLWDRGQEPLESYK